MRVVCLSAKQVDKTNVYVADFAIDLGLLALIIRGVQFTERGIADKNPVALVLPANVEVADNWGLQVLTGACMRALAELIATNQAQQEAVAKALASMRGPSQEVN
jgi:hypothetical protein